MKLILLSGGSGKRLWPMSNDSRSKQFLRILEGPDGVAISMLQRVWRQLDQVGLQSQTYICASKAQKDMIEHQLGDISFIEEPERRDTFPAIALASLYLLDQEMCSRDEVVTVAPIDHLVDDGYFRELAKLERILDASGAQIALMGVKPTEPSSKFGYIQIADAQGDRSWFPVTSFVEKPEVEAAAQLIQSGALWNCGVFSFRLGFLLDVLEQNGHPTSYAEAKAKFSQFPKRSFDYEVVEHAHSIAVRPYFGAWQDLGTWDAIAEQLRAEMVGKGSAIQCEDTHMINELGIPLIGVGLKNTMVVATPDGILVTDKAMSADVKAAVLETAGRPMYEERRWGTYRVLDYQKLPDGSEVLTKWIELNAAHYLSYQKHMKRSEVWTVVDGSGQLVVDQKVVDVTAGDVIRVHQGQWHAIRAYDKLSFVEVQRGSELVEEDILRRFDSWEEIMEHLTVKAVL